MKQYNKWHTCFDDFTGIFLVWTDQEKRGKFPFILTWITQPDQKRKKFNKRYFCNFLIIHNCLSVFCFLRNDCPTQRFLPLLLSLLPLIFRPAVLFWTTILPFTQANRLQFPATLSSNNASRKFPFSNTSTSTYQQSSLSIINSLTTVSTAMDKRCAFCDFHSIWSRLVFIHKKIYQHIWGDVWYRTLKILINLLGQTTKYSWTCKVYDGKKMSLLRQHFILLPCWGSLTCILGGVDGTWWLASCLFLA